MALRFPYPASRSRLEKWFGIVAAVGAGLYIITYLCGRIISGIFMGDIPKAFGVTTPQFLFYLFLILAMITTQRVLELLPSRFMLSSHKLLKQPDGGKTYGHIMGRAILVSILCFSFPEWFPDDWFSSSANVFYWQWGITWAVWELCSIGGIFVWNYKHRFSVEPNELSPELTG